MNYSPLIEKMNNLRLLIKIIMLSFLWSLFLLRLMAYTLLACITVIYSSLKSTIRKSFGGSKADHYR